VAIWNFGILYCGGFHNLSWSPLCLPLCEWRRAADLRERYRPAANLRAPDMSTHPTIRDADHAADAATYQDDRL